MGERAEYVPCDHLARAGVDPEDRVLASDDHEVVNGMIELAPLGFAWFAT